MSGSTSAASATTTDFFSISFQRELWQIATILFHMQKCPEAAATGHFCLRNSITAIQCGE
jgi:hypothetical protein